MHNHSEQRFQDFLVGVKVYLAVLIPALAVVVAIAHISR